MNAKCVNIFDDNLNLKYKFRKAGPDMSSSMDEKIICMGIGRQNAEKVLANLIEYLKPKY